MLRELSPRRRQKVLTEIMNAHREGRPWGGRLLGVLVHVCISKPGPKQSHLVHMTAKYKKFEVSIITLSVMEAIEFALAWANEQDRKKREKGK